MAKLCVYFIQSGSKRGPIKIGITENDPMLRLVSLRSASPWPLKLLAALEAGR